MTEHCAYCGDEIVAEAVRDDDRVFCCEECLDAFNEDSFDHMDQRLEEDY